MTRTKKWLTMLVLGITLVPTISAKADNYIAKDNIVFDTKYYEFFDHQFDKNTSYKFFAYDCLYSNYNRTCYYGIDSNNNFVKISYNSDSYNDLTITKGVDDSFSVTGTNIISVTPSSNTVILQVLVFSVTLFVILKMLGDL